MQHVSVSRLDLNTVWTLSKKRLSPWLAFGRSILWACGWLPVQLSHSRVSWRTRDSGMFTCYNTSILTVTLSITFSITEPKNTNENYVCSSVIHLRCKRSLFIAQWAIFFAQFPCFVLKPQYFDSCSWVTNASAALKATIILSTSCVHYQLDQRFTEKTSRLFQEESIEPFWDDFLFRWTWKRRFAGMMFKTTNCCNRQPHNSINSFNAQTLSFRCVTNRSNWQQ